ncbi:Adenylate cyclase [Diplonema papillatum]|nr:Adenylate cyclase [Diplonema papillatum]
MISFQETTDAVKAALDMQTELAMQDWPVDLDLDDGMLVRIGIHCGLARAEHNPLTGRSDYKGTVVNLASRVEGKAVPGSVCVTEEVMHRISGATRHLDNPVMADIGENEIKGLGTGYKLHLLTPTALGYRVTGEGEMDPRLKSLRKRPPTTDGASSCDSSSPPPVKTGTVTAEFRDAVGGRAGLRLDKIEASVAVVKEIRQHTSWAVETVSFILAVAMDGAASTEGSISSVVGSTITALWNSAKRVHLHIVASTRFAWQLEAKLATLCNVGTTTFHLIALLPAPAAAVPTPENSNKIPENK